jgi:hypothetical protein
VGTAFSVIIRLELAGPGVQYVAGAPFNLTILSGDMYPRSCSQKILSRLAYRPTKEGRECSMLVKLLSWILDWSTGRGKTDGPYVTYTLDFRGYSISLLLASIYAVVWLLVVWSAGTIRVSQTRLTSERRYESIVAKWVERHWLKNSGLPKGRNPHGNGFGIVGMQNLSRGLHTKVRKPNDSPTPRDRAVPGSLREMLVFDQDGRCTNLMKIISDPAALRSAYHRIKSKPGSMTKGSDNETLDGISDA